MDGQMTVFDWLNGSSNVFKIHKPIRLIELFGGIGSQAMALERLGADFVHWKLVEYDKYPVASYNAIHGTDFKPTDITKIHGSDLEIVDKEHFTYLLTYSFPCQDLSVAGKQKGMTKGSGTRSGLLWEVERLLNEVDNLPQVLLMENVPQVHSKQNMPDFQKWLDFLESKGYSNYWQDLNAKNYGVAQNRNRCFCVSILGTDTYKFPEPIELTKCMKDYLEDEVDNKYYITSEKARLLIDKLILEGKILTDRQTDRQLTLRSHMESQLKSQTQSQQDMMLESVNTNMSEVECAKSTAYLNYNKVEKVNVDVAKTLCARDYKGFGTGFDTMNGVIECQKLE